MKPTAIETRQLMREHRSARKASTILRNQQGKFQPTKRVAERDARFTYKTIQYINQLMAAERKLHAHRMDELDRLLAEAQADHEITMSIYNQVGGHR